MWPGYEASLLRRSTFQKRLCGSGRITGARAIFEM
jgi:hypothetical protein